MDVEVSDDEQLLTLLEGLANFTLTALRPASEYLGAQCPEGHAPCTVLDERVWIVALDELFALEAAVGAEYFVLIAVPRGYDQVGSVVGQTARLAVHLVLNVVRVVGGAVGTFQLPDKGLAFYVGADQVQEAVEEGDSLDVGVWCHMDTVGAEVGHQRAGRRVHLEDVVVRFAVDNDEQALSDAATTGHTEELAARGGVRQCSGLVGNSVNQRALHNAAAGGGHLLRDEQDVLVEGHTQHAAGHVDAVDLQRAIGNLFLQVGVEGHERVAVRCHEHVAATMVGETVGAERLGERELLAADPLRRVGVYLHEEVKELRVHDQVGAVVGHATDVVVEVHARTGKIDRRDDHSGLRINFPNLGGGLPSLLVVADDVDEVVQEREAGRVCRGGIDNAVLDAVTVDVVAKVGLERTGRGVDLDQLVERAGVNEQPQRFTAV